MTELRAWWRKLGGLMVVCLFAALLASPAVEALACAGEEQATAAAALDPQENLSSSDHDRKSGGDTAICVHGHCHHGVALGIVLAEVALEPHVHAEAHAVVSSSLFASRSPPGPERPPRV